MYAELDPWANGPPWWYGRITCDLKHHDAPVAPEYWWRGLGEMIDGRIVFVCNAGMDDLLDSGLSADEFVLGDMIGPGHWRPDA